MARKISSGLVGEPSVGGISVSPSAVISTAENQNITLAPLGTGSVVFTNNAVLNAQNDLRFADADSSNYVAFQAPATVASNVTWTLPDADGSASQALVTNGSGTLSFVSTSVVITDNTTDSGTNYLLFTTSTSGSLTTTRVATTKLTFQPSTGTLSTTVFNGALATNLNQQINSLGVGTAASGTVGEIRATNNITSFFSSDAKFKENIEDIPNALNTVLAIGGKVFDWTDEYIAAHGGEDGYFIQKQDFGVVAQDVQRVFPTAVRIKDDKSLAVDYEKLSALAFAAIVELKKEIDLLKGVK